MPFGRSGRALPFQNLTPERRPAPEGRLVGRFQRHADISVLAQEQGHFQQSITYSQVLQIDLRGRPGRVGSEGEGFPRRQVVRLVV